MNDLIKAIPKLKILEERNSPFIYNITKLKQYAENILKEIKHTFDNYTNHDIEHSISVIKYMCDAVSDFDKLSDLEIVMIIYAGLLHDIGMAVFPEEKRQIKNNTYELSEYDFSSVLAHCHNNETLAVQEIVRPIHAIRSGEFILTKMTEQRSLFEVPEMNGVYFDEIVAKICIAHNEEFEWIKLNLESDVKYGIYAINPQYIAILLRLGDLLDIDSKRTPDYLYNLLSLSGISDEEWRQHFVIKNSEKIVTTPDKLKYIEFYGSTRDAKIHRKLLNYIDWIRKELENSTTFLNESVNPIYCLNINTNIRNMIKPEGFKFSNFKLFLDYKAITNLLMGENIYNDKKCGLREIIQNSIDACKLMKEEAARLELFKYDAYRPKIIIQIDEREKTVTIYDNGIGMSFDIIKKYFLNVGVSYYNSKDCKYRGYSYTPIGNYGIGFLACFMLSDSIKIKTKRFDSPDTIIVDVEKNNDYVVFDKCDEKRSSFTEITLDATFFQVFKAANDVKEYIEQTFLDDDISIVIQDKKDDGDVNIECSLISHNIAGEETISLSCYLKEIEAYAAINKKVQYTQSLDDISNNNYVYKDGKITKYDSNIHNINDYIYDNALNYITVTLIPECLRVKFESFYEALDDYQEVIDKFEDLEDLDVINIYYNNSISYLNVFNQYIIVDTNYRRFVKSYDSSIFDYDFSVYNLLEQIDSNDLFDTNIASMYIGEAYKTVVEVGQNNCLEFNKDTYNGWFRKEQRMMFVRNVLISRYNFVLHEMAEGVKINNLIVNILNKAVIPDISRSNIHNELSKQINYAIGKAIHLWIYDNADISQTEKNLLGEFIKLNYGEPNVFVEDKYNKQKS